jgi:hypothetical protein
MVTKLIKKWILSKLRSVIKSEVYLYGGSSPSLKALQMQVIIRYQTMVKQGWPLPSIFDVGYRVFSQFDEDGILLFFVCCTGNEKQNLC